jgi:hypothetical protein
MTKWITLALIVCVAGAVQAGDDASKGKKKGKREPTKEQFVAMQKKSAEKKGTEFDLAAAEAKFVKLDKNADGKLNADEKTSGKGKKKGKKKGAE